MASLLIYGDSSNHYIYSLSQKKVEAINSVFSSLCVIDKNYCKNLNRNEIQQYWSHYYVSLSKCKHCLSAAGIF